MNSAVAQRGNRGASEGRSALLLTLGLAVAVVSASLLAFYRMYSTFPLYDDSIVVFMPDISRVVPFPSDPCQAPALRFSSRLASNE